MKPINAKPPVPNALFFEVQVEEDAFDVETDDVEFEEDAIDVEKREEFEIEEEVVVLAVRF